MSRTATSPKRKTREQSQSLTRRELLTDCAARLRTAGISNAAQEAGWLLESGLRLSRLELHLNPDSVVAIAGCEGLMALCTRRAGREPLQYLLGTQEFCGLEFVVDPGVLIPRPETELLVDEVVRHCARLETPVILEIGTGSGCIVVSIAARLPKARIYATDVSLRAIRVAALNAGRHGVAGRIRFLVGDLFQPLGADLHGRVMAVVSNPPYIPDASLDDLQPEVRFEPRLALAGGPDGLHFHRRLVTEARRLLSPAGLLALEAGEGQAPEVVSMMEAFRWYDPPRISLDGTGIARVVSAVRSLR
jgi:release factor glutamine methyltransferase